MNLLFTKEMKEMILLINQVRRVSFFKDHPSTELGSTALLPRNPRAATWRMTAGVPKQA